MAAAAILNLLFLFILVKWSIFGDSRIYFCKISFIYVNWRPSYCCLWKNPKLRPPVGRFWKWVIECCQSNFFSTNFRCHKNKFWDKIGYNSACVKNFWEDFFAYMAVYENVPSNFANRISPTDPCCYGNEIWDKIGYNSVCVQNFFAKCLRL